MCKNDFKFEVMPKYLRLDLDNYIKCVNENNFKDWDIYWSSLYGSINSAEHDDEITVSLADDIRKEWL